MDLHNADDKRPSPVCCRLPIKLDRRFRQLARTTKQPLNQLLIEAVELYLNHKQFS